MILEVNHIGANVMEGANPGCSQGCKLSGISLQLAPWECYLISHGHKCFTLGKSGNEKVIKLFSLLGVSLLFKATLMTVCAIFSLPHGLCIYFTWKKGLHTFHNKFKILKQSIPLIFNSNMISDYRTISLKF